MRREREAVQGLYELETSYDTSHLVSVIFGDDVNQCSSNALNIVSGTTGRPPSTSDLRTFFETTHNTRSVSSTNLVCRRQSQHHIPLMHKIRVEYVHSVFLLLLFSVL
jgi:hypothetical protein